MTVGIGYFYDKERDFEEKINPEIVKWQRVATSEGEAQLKYIIEPHYQLTGSERADKILGNWEEEKKNFWQMYPPSESKTMIARALI